MKPQKQHLATLDTLRGIAALSVCLYHYTGAVLPKVIHEPTKSIFSWGWVGVEIFFVISGFIIPYVLMRSNYQWQDFGGFMGKRVVRICPPSWIALALTIAQFYAIDQIFHRNWTGTMSAGRILANLTYTVPFTGYEWVNGVFWTLAVEFQFYLLIALIFPLAFRNKLTYVAFCVLLSATYYLPLAEKTVQLLHYNSMFLIGGAAVLHLEKRVSTGFYLALLAGLAVIAYFQLGLLPMLFGTVTALLISFVRIKNKAGHFLGKISYSLYLNHILVGSTIEVILVRVIPPTSIAAKLLITLICIGGTIAFSYIFYLLVEERFINLANRMFGKKPVAPKLAEPAKERTVW